MNRNNDFIFSLCRIASFLVCTGLLILSFLVDLWRAHILFINKSHFELPLLLLHHLLLYWAFVNGFVQHVCHSRHGL